MNRRSLLGGLVAAVCGMFWPAKSKSQSLIRPISEVWPGLQRRAGLAKDLWSHGIESVESLPDGDIRVILRSGTSIRLPFIEHRQTPIGFEKSIGASIQAFSNDEHSNRLALKIVQGFMPRGTPT